MEKLVAAPRWLFLGTLLYAPWAYGCTRPWTISVLERLLATVVALWLAGCLAERRWPRVPALALLLCALLLAQGWFMAWNARDFYDPELLQFVPVPAALPSAPGSIDGSASREMMRRISALLAAMLFAIDFFRDPIWRRRFAWTIVIAGSSVVAFGLVQRILGAPMIFWGEARDNQHFFATYFYHGNAGSFINLVLPFIALWTLRIFRQRETYLARALCVPALLLTTAGALVNVSKAAMSITAGLLLALGLIHLPDLWRSARERGTSRVLLGVLLLLVAVVVLVAAGGPEMAWQRWAQLGKILQSNPREIALGVGWKMAADSGWAGFGAGTLGLAFPHYTGQVGQQIEGIWLALHQDYLQAVIEWGWIGATLWAALIFGGAALAAWHGCKKGAPLSEARPLYLAAALALGATALHALVDFPFQIASLQLYVLTFSALGWSAWFRR